MFKKIAFFAIGILSINNVFACDSCLGTSLNGLDGQLLPSNKSFFGLNTSYVHQLNGKKDKLNTISYNAFLAYTFNEKWQIFANLPLHHRISSSSDNSQVGLGDASLMLSYNIFETPKDKITFSNSKVIVRGGIKFPTGYYNLESDQYSSFGSKSFDFLFGAQYIFEMNSNGFNTAFNARINTLNKDDFRYGHKYDFSAFYFNKIKKTKNAFMPYAGFLVDYYQKDLSNGFVRNLSGGEGLYGLGGFMWNWNSSFAIISRIEIPAYQNYQSADGKVYNNVKAQLQFTYYIKKKEKISKTINLNLNENN